MISWLMSSCHNKDIFVFVNIKLSEQRHFKQCQLNIKSVIIYRMTLTDNSHKHS